MQNSRIPLLDCGFRKLWPGIGPRPRKLRGVEVAAADGRPVEADQPTALEDALKDRLAEIVALCARLRGRSTPHHEAPRGQITGMDPRR